MLHYRAVGKVLEVAELAAQAERRGQRDIQQVRRGAEDFAPLEPVNVFQDQPASVFQQRVIFQTARTAVAG